MKHVEQAVSLDGRMRGADGAAKVHGRGKSYPGDDDTNNGGQRDSFKRFPLPGLQLQQHVDRFARGCGASVADGRHLVHLLQLELRDVVRRGAEAEAEVSHLRERLQRINSSRIEKEVIDRQSFAGIALAHADASVELRNRLESAHAALRESQAEKDALTEDLLSKADSIARQERREAELTTAAEFGHEAQIQDMRKALEEKHRQVVEQINLTWEQRLVTAEGAYTTALRRWAAGEALPPSVASRDQHAALVPLEALRQLCAKEYDPRQLVNNPSKRSILEQPPPSVYNDHVERCAGHTAKKLPVKAFQPFSPTHHQSDGWARDDGPIHGASKASMTLRNPNEVGLTAQQSFQPSTPHVKPKGEGRCSPPIGFQIKQSEIPRSAWTTTRQPSSEESSRFESVPKSISGSLSADMSESPSTGRPESVSNSTSESVTRGRGSKSYGQGPQLERTLFISGRRRQGTAHQVKSGSLVRAGRGAPDTLNPATDAAGEARRRSNDTDIDGADAAAAGSFASMGTGLCSSSSEVQQQHDHQTYEPCVSIPSWEAGRDEEQEGPRASTSSKRTSDNSMDIVSRSTERSTPSSSGRRRPYRDERQPSDEFKNDEDRHSSLHHGAGTVESSSSNTKRLSRSLSLASNPSTPAIATSRCVHPKSSLASGSSRGAPDTLNFATDTAGEARRHPNDTDIDGADAAAVEAFASRGTGLCSSSSEVQQQHDHQTYESCVSIPSWEAGRDEEQEGPRASTSSKRTSDNSMDIVSRSTERSALSSSGRRSYRDEGQPSDKHENDGNRHSSLHHGADTAGSISSNTKRLSRSLSLASNPSSPDIATSRCAHPKSSLASGFASSTRYESGPASSPSDVGSCSDPGNSSQTHPSREDSRTACESDAFAKSRYRSAPVSAFECEIHPTSPSRRGSSWSQSHPSSRTMSGRGGFSYVSARTETPNYNRAAVYSNRRTSRPDDERQAPSTTPVSSYDEEFSRAASPSVREGSKGSEISPHTPRSPPPSWPSQSSSHSSAQQLGPWLETRRCSNSGESSRSIAQPGSHFSYRNGSGGTQSGEGGAGDGVGWSADVVSETISSTRTHDSKRKSSTPSIYLESRIAPRDGASRGHVRSDFGSSERIKSPSQSSMQHPGPRQCSLAGKESRQPISQPDVPSHSASGDDSRRSDRNQSVATMSTRRSSRRLERSVPSSSSISPSTPDGHPSPPDEISRGSIEGDLCSQERTSPSTPAPLMNTSDTRFIPRYVERAQWEKDWTGDGRGQVKRRDSRQGVLSKSTHLSTRYRGSRPTTPSQPVTSLESKPPPSSSSRTDGTGGSGIAMEGRAQISTATSVLAPGSDEVFEIRSVLNGSLDLADRRRIDVPTAFAGHSQPPSTIASSRESLGDKVITCAPTRSNHGFESQSNSRECSVVSGNSSKGSRPNRDGETANRRESFTNGSASAYDSISTGSFQSGSRTGSRLHGQSVDLDHSARRGATGGTTTYSLSRKEAGSSGPSCSGSSLISTLSTRGTPVGEVRPQRWPTSRSLLSGGEGDDGGHSQPSSTIASSRESLGDRVITCAPTRSNHGFEDQSSSRECSVVSGNSSKGSRPNRDGETANRRESFTNGSASAYDSISTGSFQSGSRTGSRLHGQSVDLDHSARRGATGGTTTYSLSRREAGSSGPSCSGSSLISTLSTRGTPVGEVRPQRWPTSRSLLSGGEGDDAVHSQPSSTIASSRESLGDRIITCAPTRSNHGFESQSNSRECSVVSGNSSKGSRPNRDGVTANRRGSFTNGSASAYDSISTGSFQSESRTGSRLHGQNVVFHHSAQRGATGGTTTYSLSRREAGSSGPSCSGSSLDSTLSTPGGLPVGQVRPQRWPTSRSPVREREGDGMEDINDSGSYLGSIRGSDESRLSRSSGDH